MKKFSGVVIKLSQIMDKIAGFCMFAVMVLTTGNVVLRAFFNRPILGSYDYVMILSAVMIALSLSKCAADDGHIAVDYFIERAPLKMRAVVGLVMNVVSFVFWGFCTWQIAVYAHKRLLLGEVTAAAEIPLYPFIYLIGFGLLALCLVLLERSMEFFQKGSVK